MKNCFFAYTPMQLINIINTKSSYYQTEQADLYLSTGFKGAKEIREKLENFDLFDNIYLFSEPPLTFFQRVQTVFFNEIKYIPVKMDFYDRFFFSGSHYLLGAFFGQNVKNNSNIELNYIEDGISTYTFKHPKENLSTIQRIIDRLVNRHSINQFPVTNYYVYAPEMAKTPKNLAKKLPKIKSDGIVYEILTSIFAKSELSEEPKGFLFLDQPLKQDFIVFTEKDLLAEIKKYLPQNKKLYVKLHPRGDRENYHQEKVIEVDTPFELFVMEIPKGNLEFISLFSTPLLTSLTMFDLDIKMIVLSKCIINNTDLKLGKRLAKALNNFNKFLDKYEGKNLIVPENMEELKDALSK